MKESLEILEREIMNGFKAARSAVDIDNLKKKYLARKGPLAALIKELAGLPAEERRILGEAINEAKKRIEGVLDDALATLRGAEKSERLGKERLDVTLPGRSLPSGRIHPVTSVTSEIEDIFTSLGFEIAEGPEVELDYYNFEALNIPKDHPARDMQDTFYLSGGVCLRTHTSPVQIRVMEKRRPPLRVIAPGTVYRRDSDITHTPMFHQVEGFMVDEGVSFSALKGVLTHFLHRLFGEDTGVRFRPSFFPFTEPSAEVDIRCVMCAGKGCRVCKGSGWLEILGCGMIHPNVFKSVDYDYGRYSGFAFGLGIERIAMLKHGIDDIRLFFENDIRFLRQF
ncbi:MAG: phenylalanine--tRNA ligase subunit alpha [Deltaproteobacteria bacterium]|nr:phenylalanine--tRNA ligase subunit alpha [Deltaproteobacteria bacterium]